MGGAYGAATTTPTRYCRGDSQCVPIDIEPVRFSGFEQPDGVWMLVDERRVGFLNEAKCPKGSLVYREQVSGPPEVEPRPR